MRDTGVHMTHKNFRRVLFGRALFGGLLFLSVLLFAVPGLRAQSAEVRATGVYYIDGGTTINGQYCNWDPDDLDSRSSYNKSAIVNVGDMQTNDPWQTSALIEYDQPYPSPVDNNDYPNHCLALCMDVYCTNKPNGATTYSISFPIQNIMFEIVKYRNGADISNPETNPAIRTIYQSILDNTIVGGADSSTPGSGDLSDYMCAAYSCIGSSSDPSYSCTCPNPQYECIPKSGNTAVATCAAASDGYCCRSLNNPTVNYTNSTSVCGSAYNSHRPYCGSGDSTSFGGETTCIVRAEGTGRGFNDPIRFCTPWDGSYEIQGEFGKTNGQFGFRGTISTEYPGDGIAVQQISINQTYPYPGNNQYPIQVDVTNVHTVRTTPTVIGSITGVQATPYAIAYRLSKDADVKIEIFDASAQVPYTGDSGDDPFSDDINQGIIQNSDAELILTGSSVVRTLVDWQPRLGEGMQGSNDDKAVVESDSWDGRDDSGRLLPANNYLVSVQAKSQDEWPGTDFSRAVTRQLSLDPLKLTDIEVQGLNKQSTAYAVVRYVPTEASNVYFEVYSPGTTFESLYTKGFEPTGSRPVIAGGSGVLVSSNNQQRGRGASYADQWDGLCHSEATDKDGKPVGCQIPYSKGTKLPISGTIFEGGNAGDSCDGGNGTINADGNCVVSYANGAPLPDGDYVYVLWAEVPYTDIYYNGAACYTDQNPAGKCNLSQNSWNCTGKNGNYSCTVDNQPCSNTDLDDVPVVCSGAYTGVKTRKYYTGTLPVERGVVDITIQPVSYSTIGSSPAAYGLDPFIFRYSVAREAVVEAEVRNTAGVLVKTLTDEGGNTNVAQQMNTLTWDGRDDQGRMVGPGTYMFVVKTKDPMFPQSVQTQASALFPVDLYRVVDVSTTDVYGDSNARATISYMLSKAMNVQINVYNKDVVIPNYSDEGTDTQTETYESTVPQEVAELFPAEAQVTAGNEVGSGVSYSYHIGPETATDIVAGTVRQLYTEPVVTENQVSYYVAEQKFTETEGTGATRVGTFVITAVLQVTKGYSNAAWPPRVCDYETDGKGHFMYQPPGGGNAVPCPGGNTTTCYVEPTTNPQCIYVNDKTFTHYPANPNEAQYNYVEGGKQTLDVRLQPVKTFNRSATRAGDGVMQTEEWDAQYFYNPTPVSVVDGGKNTIEAVQACANQTDLSACPYEMIPDGTYPFYISARTEEGVSLYYDSSTAQPYRYAADDKTPGVEEKDKVQYQTGLYATDKPTYRINITRGPVYFLDGTVAVYPNAPQLFNTSSGPVLVPPYEINFAISRAATVEVAVVALEDGLCTTPDLEVTDGSPNTNRYNARAGDVCKYLSTMTIANTANFDPNIVRRMYWDGTDNNGYYVRNGNYEIRLTAKNYPDEGLYQPTVKSVTQNVELLQVYDLPEVESYALNTRGSNMNISYQISVPMKVAIQILKPGTTIYDYQKGTLRDPATGREVTDIRDVLVKAIVGIRPATTLIEEVWDGTDYAQQDVPDGTYPFRFVTALESADIDSVTGEILNSDDGSTDRGQWSIQKVADTGEYVNLHHATVAIGDGEFVCEDWEKTVFFYPNPFKTPTGTLEVTKLPVPGTMSLKFYNLAGDLVRDRGYTCVDANNMTTTMGTSIELQPDNTVSNTPYSGNMPSVRNAALRCFWDRTNDHGKRVARGVYFGLVDFRAANGRQHCQKVVKILIPR